MPRQGHQIKIKRQKVPSVGNNEIVDKNGVTDRICIWIMSFGSLFTSVYFRRMAAYSLAQ